MTESEKIKKAIYSLGFIKGILYNGIFADRIDCIDYAISALEEILEYRRIGSLIECRDAMEFWKTRQELDAKIEKCMGYEKIGNVEECREAVEKQKKKAPIYEGDGYADGHIVYDIWVCPSCEAKYEVDCDDFDYCPKCGQAINKNLEGIEYEED